MAKRLSGLARRELIAAVRGRYSTSEPSVKREILREFSAITGYHRKSAIRILNGNGGDSEAAAPRQRHRLYDDAFRSTLIVLWEASDRVCGKRLRALLPLLVPALERHGHLVLDSSARVKLLAVSAATIDRLLAHARGLCDRRRVRRAPTALRRSVPIRTSADWNSPEPGFMEIDLVAHCGDRLVGAFVYTLTLTDIASTWTECVPLLVRTGALVVETIDRLRGALPFRILGLDIDNGGEFRNETLVTYCVSHGIELTRSRPYRKNGGGRLLGRTLVNCNRIGSKGTVPLKVAAISGCAPQVSAETVALLEQLLEEARAGTVTGLAVAVLRSKGNDDLRLRGNATESGNQMSVAGMLAALQKMVLELAD
jgi:hypothetical protein